MDQGIGSLGSLDVLGVEFVRSRGVSPSVGLVRMRPAASFDRFVGDLSFTYGGEGKTFGECAVVDVCQRNFHGREGFRWSAVVQDRRWKWRYPRISGEYNRRLCDGSVDTVGKKNARELGQLLADELGDSIDVSGLPTSVWPHVKWDNALARFELQTLADKFGLVVCPKSGDNFALEPIMQTASLPVGGVEITPSTFSFKPAVMPSKLVVEGTRKYKQGWVQLQALGLDTDGKIPVIDSLSYSPGWSTQWPHAFPDVAEQYRHLAFETVYRWYGPVDPTIILTDHTLETGLDVPANRKRCLPPQIRGQFFSHDDFGTTTTSQAIYTGKYRLREDLNLYEFHYPAYIVDGTVSPAILEVNTGYYQIDEDGNPDEVYSKDQTVGEAPRTTKPRVLAHPELRFRQIDASLYQSPTGDNQSELDAEAQEILSSVSSGYSYSNSKHVLYNGIVDVELSGGVAQLMIRAGNGRVATTEVGVNHEFHRGTPHHQERRTRERSAQVAERLRL